MPFFINTDQDHWFDEKCNGTFLYDNRVFYSVAIHDERSGLRWYFISQCILSTGGADG